MEEREFEGFGGIEVGGGVGGVEFYAISGGVR